MPESELIGHQTFIKGLDELPIALQQEVIRRTNAAMARALRKTVRNAAPKRTGFLRKEIRTGAIRRGNVRIQRQGFSHLVGVGNAYYAYFLEEGTTVRFQVEPSKSVGQLSATSFFANAVNREAAKGIGLYAEIFNKELARVEDKYSRDFFELSSAEKRRLTRR